MRAEAFGIADTADRQQPTVPKPRSASPRRGEAKGEDRPIGGFSSTHLLFSARQGRFDTLNLLGTATEPPFTARIDRDRR